MVLDRRRRYRVLDVEIDAANHAVRRGSASHHLRAQTMAVLIHLLEHSDRLVSKDELLRVVWRDVAVTDEALTQCIMEIRRALGDDHRRPRFLRTVHKGGYQFIAPVCEAARTLQDEGAPVTEPLIVESAVAEVAVVDEPVREPTRPEPRQSLHQTVAVRVVAAVFVGAVIVWGIVRFNQAPAGAPGDQSAAGSPTDVAAPAVLTNNARAYEAYRAGLDHVVALRGTAAIEAFQRAVDLDPEFAMAHGRLGFAHAFILGGSVQAQKHLETALRLESRLTEFDRLQIQAWYAVARQDFGSAISLFQEVVRQRPQEAEGHARLAKLLAGEGRFDEVLTSLRSGLALSPKSREMLNELCLVLSDLRRYSEALTACRELLAVDPGLANSHDSLGLTLEASGDETGALTAYGRAMELDPSFEVAVIHRGNLFYRQGRYARAIQEFERYLTIAPETHQSRGLEVLALAWWRRGDAAKAEQYLAAARRAGPADEITAIGVLMASGSRTQVVKLAGGLPYEAKLTRGFRLSPRLEAARQGRYALATGRSEEALRWFRQALSLRPVTWNIEWFDDCLGDALLELNRFDEAIVEYQRVLRERPNTALARFHLAEAYDRKGNSQAARQNYARFLELWRDADPDGLEVMAARQRLAGKD
jgi:tetratricopeptide (TPR) repeat protein/DNA-binding winged helix-turn-helix (wHTH) protein